MRLKAENLLAVSDDTRKKTALEAILKQVARLDTLLRNLLQMAQAGAGEPKARDVELVPFQQSTIEPHQELAAANGLSLEAGTPAPNKCRYATRAEETGGYANGDRARITGISAKSDASWILGKPPLR
jgi:signal transduction histidine kinase